MDIVEISFFDSSRTVKRPVHVLSKASLFFKNMLTGVFQESGSRNFHLKDFPSQEFMDILHFIDDPYQPAPQTEISVYLGLEPCVMLKVEPSSCVVPQNPTFLPLSGATMDDVHTFRRRIPNHFATPCNCIQKDVSINEEKLFPIVTPGIVAFQFRFVWPQRNTIRSIQLISRDEKEEKVVIEFQGAELFYSQMKGYNVALFPLYHQHDNVLFLNKRTLFFRVQSDHLNMMKMLFVTPIFNSATTDRYTTDLESLHMVPRMIGTMDLSKPNIFTFESIPSFFNTIYFLLCLRKPFGTRTIFLIFKMREWLRRWKWSTKKNGFSLMKVCLLYQCATFRNTVHLKFFHWTPRESPLENGRWM
jgi:hypothetical protein